MKKILYLILIAIIFLSLHTSCDNYEVPIAKSYEGITSTRIWDKAGHSAFTSLIRFNEYFYCAFREGVSHVGDGGVIRIIKSKDGLYWETAEVLQLKSSGASIDLRDPKLSVTPDNRIMIIVDGEFYRGGAVSSRRPYISYSDTNGENFSELMKSNVYYPTENMLSDSSFWMWSLFNHKATYYAFDYLCFTLFKSSDVGKTFYPIKRLDYEGIGEKPSETALYIDSTDKMYAFIRRTNANGYLGTSISPYTDWTYQELDFRLEGQNVIPLNNNSFIVGTRRFDENNINPQAAIYVTDLEGKIKKEFILPSSGDCSYPGMILDKSFLWISYYSSHEGRTSIYFTKIPLSNLT